MGNNNKGKKSVIGDSESDEEDPVRATLKAKIREMKNKQLQRLLDLVELIKIKNNASADLCEDLKKIELLEERDAERLRLEQARTTPSDLDEVGVHRVAS